MASVEDLLREMLETQRLTNRLLEQLVYPKMIIQQTPDAQGPSEESDA